jgi:hypothetical protein
MPFQSITIFYKNVLEDDITPLLERHEKFPDLVLTCALNEGRFDVAGKLLDLGFRTEYCPAWLNVWTSDASTVIGYSQRCIETKADKLKKFKTCKFLIDRGIYTVNTLIPTYLKHDWSEFIEDDEQLCSTGCCDGRIIVYAFTWLILLMSFILAIVKILL